MRNGLRVPEQLYLKTVLLVLERFPFLFSLLFLLYSKESYHFERVSTVVWS
jgi:hypothetical protein